MAMKLLCGCLLAVVLLGCLADAQYGQIQQQQRPQTPPQPQRPQTPPRKYTPLQPTQPPQPPQPPHAPQPQPFQPIPQIKQSQQPAKTFHTCEVAEAYKLQCGAADISASDCQAINCCFDGRMCYYGKSVTLQCTKDAQFILVVARDATLPNLDLESIAFFGEGQRCSPVGTTSAFAIYQFPVTECGTVMMEESGVIIYENRMNSLYEVAIGPYGSITRDSHYELLVQCRYISTSVEALVIEVGLVFAPSVAAPGPLRVELRLGNGQCANKGCAEEDVAYSSFYVDSDYPVTKVLRDPVYVEVRMLERTDPNLVLTVGRCWATSNPYPHSLPQWDLLIDGCPYRDDRYLTACVPVGASSGLVYPSHHKRFIFKMFTFVATGDPDPSAGGSADQVAMTILKEKVYIHCEAIVCRPTPGNNCEPRCYRKRRSVAASVQGGSRAETTVVSSKELVIIDPSRIQKQHADRTLS